MNAVIYARYFSDRYADFLDTAKKEADIYRLPTALDAPSGTRTLDK